MPEATLSAYNPTWRDRLATWMLGDARPTAGQRDFVSGLLGSAGTGSTGMSVADMTPLGGLLGAQENAQAGDYKAAAMAALPMPAAKGAKGIIAYHGSPHSFDRFDLSKIGTGEGAQAYGHGLYFAEHEPVAKAYRDANQTYKTFLNGDPIEPSHPQFSPVMSIGANGYDKALKQAEEFAAAGFIKPEELDAIRALKGAKIEQKPGGSMYQVRINADPSHFLDYDSPIAAQPNMAQNYLGKELRRYLGSSYVGQLPNFENKSAGEILEQSKGRMFSTPQVSTEMRKAGIPGIKYLDQGSRGAGEGSRNYVVFDDKLIDILKKYGLVGLLGGGAAMNAQSPNAQQGAPSL